VLYSNIDCLAPLVASVPLRGKLRTWHRGLGYRYSKVNRIVRNKNYGYSIRLVCD